MNVEFMNLLCYKTCLMLQKISEVSIHQKILNIFINVSNTKILYKHCVYYRPVL